MRKIWLSILASVALATVSHGAELKLLGEAKTHNFVRIESDVPGRWVVIGPDTLSFQKLLEVAGTQVGQLNLNRREVITLREGREIVFVGPAGLYCAVMWPAGEEDPSFLPVQITGAPDPKPGPQPGPQPDPKPPVNDKLFVLVVRETGVITPEQGKIFTSKEIREYLLARGFKLRIVDPGEVDAEGKVPADIGPYLERCKGKPLPFLFITSEKGELLYEGALPATEAAVIELLKSKGGV